MNIEEMTKDIVVVKRNGNTEPFSPEKMKRLLNWACDGNEALVDVLMKDTIFKINSGKIRTDTILRRLTETASDKVSVITPDWQYVAARLYLLDQYAKKWKEINFREGEYPHLRDVFKGSLYDDQFLLGAYEDYEIDDLNSYVDMKRDTMFTYAGIYYMFNKYCLGRELPQHTYMRVAMALFSKDNHPNRVEFVKQFYDILSTHKVTVATPIMLNAGTKHQQLSSCVLVEVDDTTDSILDSAETIATYSKNNAGLGVDISRLRSKGSKLTGGGKASGPVPFLKIYEYILKAWDQRGTRPGSSTVHFPWWHADVMDLAVLRRNDGTEDTRARSLKYSVKSNKTLFDAVDNDEDVYLFDPVDAPKLWETWGEEWKTWYDVYVITKKYKKVVSARELIFEILKTRVETGNLYVFYMDNVNEQNPIKDRIINMSNLCHEVTQPTSPHKPLTDEALYTSEGTPLREKREIPAEISLCTLSSVNLSGWPELPLKEKKQITQLLVRALDNTFDIALYPAKGAELTSKRYRYLGIGVLNYARMLAENKLKWEDKETLDFVDNVFRELKDLVYEASESLAKERGPYPAWNESHGKMRRNALLLAIAPTASSGRVIGATEGIDPIRNFYVRYEATINLPFVLPNLRELRPYYQKAFDIDPYVVIDHAVVRQKHLDQSQSVSFFLTGEYTKSARKLYELHKYALEKGIKTLYYVHTLKESEQAVDECEGCSV